MPAPASGYAITHKSNLRIVRYELTQAISEMARKANAERALGHPAQAEHTVFEPLLSAAIRLGNNEFEAVVRTMVSGKASALWFDYRFGANYCVPSVIKIRFN